MEQELLPREPHELIEETQNVGSHFIDSGAFTLRSYAHRWSKQTKKDPLKFFDSDVFWKYLESYARFIKTYGSAIDLCANLDVIESAELSLRNLKVLEKEYGVNAIPVVHNGNDYRYLLYYIRKGYPLIGLGGLAGRKRGDNTLDWVDGAFNIICNTKNAQPAVKIHGFGVGEFNALFTYPWYSVDNAGWSSSAAYGSIQVPRFRGGRFRFDEKPYVVVLSDESPEIEAGGEHHFYKMNLREKKIVTDWLKFAKLPLGTRDEAGGILQRGVTNYHTFRRLSNLIYYYYLAQCLPNWKRSFSACERPTLMEFGTTKGKSLDESDDSDGPTKFYYSGLSARGAFPEDVMSNTNLMLTFFTSYRPIIEKEHTPDPVVKWPLEKRFERVYSARVKYLANRKGSKK